MVSVKRLAIYLALPSSVPACPSLEMRRQHRVKALEMFTHQQEAHQHVNETYGWESSIQSQLLGRWYSVPIAHSASETEWVAWLVMCGTQQWVRYCFVDNASAYNLLPIIAVGIAYWAAAFKYSGLRIQPDYACNGDYRCICGAQPSGQETAADALQISDGRYSGDPADWYEVVVSEIACGSG